MAGQLVNCNFDMTPEQFETLTEDILDVRITQAIMKYRECCTTKEEYKQAKNEIKFLKGIKKILLSNVTYK